jgi:hypothetical protein
MFPALPHRAGSDHIEAMRTKRPDDIVLDVSLVQVSRALIAKSRELIADCCREHTQLTYQLAQAADC